MGLRPVDIFYLFQCEDRLCKSFVRIHRGTEKVNCERVKWHVFCAKKVRYTWKKTQLYVKFSLVQIPMYLCCKMIFVKKNELNPHNEQISLQLDK